MNNSIKNQPSIHAKAILDCLKADKISTCLELLLTIRVANIQKRETSRVDRDTEERLKSTAIDSYNVWFFQSDPETSYYQYESALLSRFSIGLGEMFCLIKFNILDASI